MPARPATILAALALTALPAAALAQYEITISVENPVLRPGESTVVTMFAGFDPDLWGMAGVGTDFITSVGSEGWSEAAIVRPMDGPGTEPGVPSATGYDGIIAGQLNGPLLPWYADPANPIAFWRATYTAPVDITDPLEINLSTVTSRYDVYIERDNWTTVSGLDNLVEGSATIRAIPAPASASLLALGLLAMSRRGR